MNRIFSICCIFLLSVIQGCGDGSGQSVPEQSQENTATPETSEARVDERRTSVKEAPVAQYSVKTDDPLNDWYFSVSIYETPATFHYLLKLQFEEIRGEDTLKIPNLGYAPEPVLQKGPEKYSCIIGFRDREGQFREYKKVHVKGNSLKITTLKHYAVSRRSVIEE